MGLQFPLASLVVLMSATFSLASAADTASHTVTSILHSTNDINVPMGILAVVAIVVGLMLSTSGYRLFRAAVFVCGFILGGLIVASIIESVFSDKSWLETASWIGFGVGGLLIGLAAISLYTTSVFIAGAAGGVLLAFTLHTTVAFRVYPSHPNVVLVVLAVVLGLLAGILALKLERPVLIVATSFAGAVIAVWGIGYYAGEFPNAADLEPYMHQSVDKTWVYSIPDAWWAYLAGIVVLFVLGLMVQFNKTARNYHYAASSKQQSAAIGSENYTCNDIETPQERPRTNNAINYV